MKPAARVMGAQWTPMMTEPLVAARASMSSRSCDSDYRPRTLVSRSAGRCSLSMILSSHRAQRIMQDKCPAVEPEYNRLAAQRLLQSATHYGAALT